MSDIAPVAPNPIELKAIIEELQENGWHHITTPQSLAAALPEFRDASQDFLDFIIQKLIQLNAPEVSKTVLERLKDFETLIPTVTTCHVYFATLTDGNSQVRELAYSNLMRPDGHAQNFRESMSRGLDLLIKSNHPENPFVRKIRALIMAHSFTDEFDDHFEKLIKHASTQELKQEFATTIIGCSSALSFLRLENVYMWALKECGYKDHALETFNRSYECAIRQKTQRSIPNSGGAQPT